MHKYTVLICKEEGEDPLGESKIEASNIEEAIDKASNAALEVIDDEALSSVFVEILNDEGYTLESFEVDSEEQ